MTFTQLQYVVKVAQTQSISQAARLLFLSQSYLSNTIRSLEDELGITLFIRKNDGVSLSEDGEFFILHAQNILNSYDMLVQRGNKKKMEHFALGILTPRTYCNNAFAKLCKRYQKSEDIQQTIKEYNNLEKGIDDLMMRRLSVYILCTYSQSEYHIQEKCRHKNIKMEKLGDIPFELCVRKGHPLVKNKEINSSGMDVDFKTLKKYPYVDYAKATFNMSLRDIVGSESHQEIPGPSSKDILVNSISQKDLVLKSTNAYSFAISRAPSHQDPDILNIPIDGIFAQMYFCTNMDYSKNRLINEYRALIIEELKLNPKFKERAKMNNQK